MSRKHRWFSGRMLACQWERQQIAGGPGSIPGRCSSFFHCEQYVPHKTQGSVTKTHCSAIALSPICFRVQKGRIREVIEWYEDCIHFVPASSIARLGSGGGWGGGGGGGVNDDDHNGKIDLIENRWRQRSLNMEEEISIVFEGEKEEEEEWEKRNRVGELPIHWTLSIETRLEKKKTTPRRGIEPRSSAWQAEILTTILPRMRHFWGTKFTSWLFAIAYDHITLNIPVLVWSPKSSSVEPG